MILLALAIAAIALVTLMMLYRFVRELLFYRANNWDFERDAPFKWPMYLGDGSERGRLMTNSQRIRFGYPFFFAVIMICVLGWLFHLPTE